MEELQMKFLIFVPSAQLIFLLGFLIPTLCIEQSKLQCRVSEQAALLQFKGGLKDPHNLLSSWEGSECCNWKGVSCDNETKHVVNLDLGYWNLFDGPSTAWRLSGEITPLLGLKHLNYLDLSFNNFQGIGIPEFIGSMQDLSYLNLSNAGFGGRIPSHIGNLSRLQYLDLNSFYSWYSLYADDLQWLSHLSSLQYLDMNSVNLANAGDWLYAVNMLPGLLVLYFPNCQLKEFAASLAVPNLTSLASLDLSNNQYISTLPNWLFNMSKLESINLQFNQLRGSIPDAFANMASLEVIQLGKNELLGDIPQSIGNLGNLRVLDLSSNNITDHVSILAKISSGCAGGTLKILNLRGNNLMGNLSDWLAHFKVLTFLDLSNNLLQGSIPVSIGNISTLRSLFLSHNVLNGTLPETIGQLSSLNLLDVSHNLLSGIVSEVHFQDLSKLEHLSLGSNSFVFNMSSNWEPPFRLRLIGLRHCRIGPKFPPWLKKQRDYTILDLSYAEINDTAPDWIWNYHQHIFLLDLSHNKISGEVPGILKYASMSNIDLSSNQFEGPLPGLPAAIEYIDFSGNSFSGNISPLFAQPMPIFSHLIITDNIINGTIPASICNYLELYVIDLSGNLLSGDLPECWADLGSLSGLNLANNKLTGDIPSSLGTLSWLQALHLNNNSFHGELPTALKSCTRLITFDVGNNNLSGEVPTWIGESLPYLRILRLRSNMFNGIIPPQLSLLTSLQILDLASNKLSGSIPRGLANFSAMAQTHKPRERLMKVLQGGVESSLQNYGPSGYSDSLVLVTKGREMEYTKNLQYVASIDLSDNALSGNISDELASLYGLQNLNLSGNKLTGKIPENIGQLKLLESLDLSKNNLSGSIPSSVSLLTSLSLLNLSYNNLSGRIPTGHQLQTLNDPLMYIGNPGLCGPPLEECERNETYSTTLPVKDDEESEMLGFYISIILGFVAGFWAVWGILLFVDSLRYAYFKFTDLLLERLFQAFM